MSNWDKYYLDICKVVASNSKCLSRKIGAILVKDKSIISTGYNGPPRDFLHCGEERYMVDHKLRQALNYKGLYKDDCKTTCPRQLLGFKSGEGLEWCVAGHAERNCLINAAREGIPTKGAKMYMSCPIPCGPCMIEIINAGIEEIVVVSMDFYDGVSELLLNNSNLKCKEYKL